MKKRILFLFVCCSCFFAGIAQNKKNKTYQFHSINSLALLNGNNAISAGIQTVNGFAKGAWFAGIGLGLDYYQYRTVPVFADFRFEVGKNRSKFFVYSDVGINIEWVQDNFIDEPSPWNGNTRNKFGNGFYSDAGIGLKAAFKNGNAFVFSLGYSRKTMKETMTLIDWRTGSETDQKNTYRFNRVIIKTGFWF